MSGDDEIVHQMDVYICNKSLDAQLFVLQYPLRPTWRPYDTEHSQQIRFKPKSKRIEFELPVDTESENYDNSVEEERKIKHLKLNSSEVDLKQTSHAVSLNLLTGKHSTAFEAGFVHEDCLFLTPVEGMFHLRPDLEFLDPVEEEKEKPVNKELTQLQVKVKKGETMAEQQRRENSYSYLAKKEKMEEWKNLTPVLSTSRVTSRVLEHLTMKIQKEVDMSVPKTELLRQIAPELKIKYNTDRPKSPGTDESPMPETVSDEVKMERLSHALTALFKSHSVANLKDVRQWLRNYESDHTVQELGEMFLSFRPVLKTAFGLIAVIDDDVLHEWILKNNELTCIRRVYLREAIGSPQLDPLRHVVMEIIRNQETIRRNDVISAAKAKGIRITEKLFESTMREICVSKDGGFWMLKTGIN